MLKLVIQDDEGKTTVVPLVHDEITIGRQEGNTIRLTERNVSRRHARLSRQNGSLTIEDLESYNGIRVNGNLIEGASSLGESDRVQIGDYVLELRPERLESADSEESTQKLETIDAGAEDAGEGAVEGRPPSDNDRTAPLPTQVAPRRALEPKTGAGADAEPEPAKPPAPPERPSRDSAPRMARATSPASPTPATPASPLAAPTATPAAGAGPEAHGKLVVLSTNFAGRELPLDKPSVVIGRTPENDICLDHRSISRPHAKIVREEGRYAIVDLDSSNGVRVNGEEYGKVELRRGDVVDLGHVRMRFVEPGEDFVFGRDAQPVDLEAGRRRSLVWAMVAVLLVGGGVGAFAMASGGEVADSGEDVSDRVATHDEDDPDEGTQVRPEDDDGDEGGDDLEEDEADQIRAHIAEATEAVSDERWDDALEAAEDAMTIDPEDERALSLASQAEEERENHERFERFQEAVEAGDFEGVATIFQEIGRESVYRVKAQDDHDRMRDEYVEQVRGRARRAAQQGACSRVARIGADARTLWPEAGDAASVPCSPMVADAQDGDSTATTGDPQTGEDEGSTSTDGQQGGPDAAGEQKHEQSVSEIVDDAQAAARAGEFGRALRLCEDALRRSRGHSEALMVCLISACNLRNASKAERYMSQISGDQRIHARQVCLRHGVDVE